MSFKPAPYNEQSVLTAVATGDMVSAQAAFHSIFSHYRPNIYATALRLTGSEWMAEEITQDVFTKVWLHRATLTTITNFGGWLYKVAQNLTYNKIRDEKTARDFKRRLGGDETGLSGEGGGRSPIPFTGNGPGGLTELEQKEYASVLQSAIARLPEQQKKTYQLIKEQGMKRNEVAELLSVSPETVKSNLYYAERNVRSFCLARLSGDLPLLAILALIAAAQQ